MRRGTFILGFLILAMPWPAAHAQTTLRYRHAAGDKLRYIMEQQVTTTQTLKDLESESKLTIIWDMSWNIFKADASGAVQLQITIDRARLFAEGPGGKAAADSADKNEPDDALRKNMAATAKIMAAMDLHGTILPTGEMMNVKPTAESLATIMKLGGAAKEEDLLNSGVAKAMLFAPVLASGPISKGKTWSNKSETAFPGYKALMENTYTFQDPDAKDKLDRIATKPEMKIEGVAKSPIKVQLKDHKGTGHILFDNKTGRVVETMLDQRTQMTLESMGTTINQTVDQRVIVRLKEQ